MEMNNALLSIFFLMVTTISTISIFKYLSHQFSGRSSKSLALPPSPKALPIIGHIHLLTDMPHHSFFKLSNQFGPIMFLKLGQIPTIVISSAKLAREVLKTHDNVLCNRPHLISADYLAFGSSDVAYSSYSPYWRHMRKLSVNEFLSPKMVSSFQFIRSQEIDRMLSTLSTRSGLDIDMGLFFFVLANDVVCRAAFGKRFESESGKREGQEMGKRLMDVLVESQDLLAGFCMGDLFPKWGWVNFVSGCKKRMERSLDDLREICDQIIEEHLRKVEQGGAGENDFLDGLLKMQKHDNLEVPITDDNIRALIMGLFEGGTSATSSTMEWTLTELVRHPKAMKKAQEEVRNISSQQGYVTVQHLQHLNYLKMAIKEALRLHPPAPLLVPRESMQNCVIDGYEISAKTRVIINTFSIGRDSTSWDEPLRYNPERFAEGIGILPSANVNMSDKGQDFKFLPFGGGRRACPGHVFGLATIELALARLLFHFDWSTPSGVEAAEKMDDLTESFGTVIRKKVPLVLVPTVNMAHPLKEGIAIEAN